MQSLKQQVVGPRGITNCAVFRRLCSSTAFLSLLIAVVVLSSAGCIISTSAAPLLLGLLEGHTDGVLDVDLSPDGRFIATASADTLIRIWSTAGGSFNLTKVIDQHHGWVRSVHFSRDGQLLLSSCDDGTSTIFRTKDWKAIRTLRGHKDYVVDGEFTPNGKYLVTASADETARIWRTSDGKNMSRIQGHTGMIHGLSVQPGSEEAEIVATVSEDRTLRLWKMSDGTFYSAPLRHNHPVHAVAFAQNGLVVVTGAEDGKVRTWKIKGNYMLREFNPPHVGGVRSVATSNSASLPLVASGSRDGVTRLWRLSDGELLAQLPPDSHSGSIDAIAFSADGSIMATASGDRTVRIWNVQDLESSL